MLGKATMMGNQPANPWGTADPMKYGSNLMASRLNQAQFGASMGASFTHTNTQAVGRPTGLGAAGFAQTPGAKATVKSGLEAIDAAPAGSDLRRAADAYLGGVGNAGGRSMGAGFSHGGGGNGGGGMGPSFPKTPSMGRTFSQGQFSKITPGAGKSLPQKFGYQHL